MSDEMKIIDFSQGIRSEEIQHNFDVIEDQIAQERLTVAGHGVSSGLDFTITDFTLKITEGSLVDVDGKNVFIAAKDTAICIEETKNIVQTKEIVDELCFVDKDGVITLKNIPYALNKKFASDSVDISQSGVYVTDLSDTDIKKREIKIIKIAGNKVTVNASWGNRYVYVKYSYTNKRYDTVYIDKGFQIKVVNGTTSTSPSVRIPTEYSYILGFIEVDPYAKLDGGKTGAKLTLKKDMRALRNLYTDDNNELFICGVPFKDLQLIHMAEPIDPSENTLWYDGVNNKLKVWQDINGIEQWVYVNDRSVVPVLESKIWAPEDNPSDLQTFKFDLEKDLNMLFIPGMNELEILIDQVPLHSDQFEEITQGDPNNIYENTGVGFKLGAPLERAGYVEARVTHRTTDNPIPVRFQRSATFVATGSHEYVEAENTKDFETNAPYRYGEEQLEVFADGRRLVKDIEYVEGIDLETPKKGNNSRKFRIIKNLVDHSLIAYKITSIVYSYDHINKILDDIEIRIETAEDVVAQQVIEIEKIKQENAIMISEFDADLKAVQDKEKEHETFLKKDDVLTRANLPEAVNNNIPNGLVNLSIVKSATIMEIEGVDPEDFIMMFDIQGLGGNSIIRRGTDYSIEKDTISGKVYLHFINPDIVENGHTLYITGIKLGI